MHPPVPAPTAQGAFAKTPLPHLLVYALERRLTGTIELARQGAPVATILFGQGFPSKIRIGEPIFFLGDVMLEMGMISREQHAASMAMLQQAPRLHGQALLAMGIVDPPRLEAALRAQLERKLEHLFMLPPDTLFAYYDGADGLQRYGGAPTPVDPFPLLWRGIRQSASWEHVDGTLRRVGAMAIRVAAHAQLERFLLGRAEAAVVDLLRQRPMRVVDLVNTKIVGPSAVQLLVYCLVITKQVEMVEMVETTSARPPPQAQPQGLAPSALQPQPQPLPGGQAFARVQLQPMQVQRSPLVVAEEVSTTALQSNDGRISMQPPIAQPQPPEGAARSSLTSEPDIAGLILSTIGDSIPPTPGSQPPPPGPPGSEIPPAAGSTGALPATSDRDLGGPALTPEQNALKAKILEKAAQITSQNYFQMLGVDPEASTETIQKAFFALAKVWHPDRLPPALIDVRDACSKVFTHITEAHATLTDQSRRQDYMTLLKEGGATPDDQLKIQQIIEATQEFQKAEFHLKRNENDKAYELASRALALDPDQMDYLAMCTWLEAQQPQWLSREKTLEKIAVLDRCINTHPKGERAYFWRGMLYKRIEETSKAMKDLRKAMELNPRNLDAAREVRLYNMRGGSKPPPGAPGGGSRASKAPPGDGLGGLFGKLFKK